MEESSGNVRTGGDNTGSEEKKKEIIEERKGGISILEIPAGGKLFIRYMVGETVDSLASTKRTTKGTTQLRFEVDSVVVVEELSENRMTAKHLRFAREKRIGRLLTKPEVKVWPRLRVAMKNAGVASFNVPGGLEYAITYGNEMLVADFSTSGSNGWIVKRDRIGEYLDALPPIEDNGEIDEFWIHQVGFLNFPDECSVRLVNHDPRNEEPVFWPKNSRYENRVAAQVKYDTGSRRVKQIKAWSEKKDHQWMEIEAPVMAYKVRPVERDIVVGKRLPQEALKLKFGQ